MGNNTSIVREAIKQVVGIERYKDLKIYVNKNGNTTNLKVMMFSWANLTDDEVEAVVNKVKEQGVWVMVKEGCSGSRMLAWVKFIVENEA